jgi:hypothetical protein
MRLREFLDVDRHMLALKDEINALTVLVRQLNRKHAQGDYERAQKRLAAAQVELELLSRPVKLTPAS